MTYIERINQVLYGECRISPFFENIALNVAFDVLLLSENTFINMPFSFVDFSLKQYFQESFLNQYGKNGRGFISVFFKIIVNFIQIC